MSALLEQIAAASLQGGLYAAGAWTVSRLFPRLPGAARTTLFWCAAASFALALCLPARLELPVLPRSLAAPATGAPQTAVTPVVSGGAATAARAVEKPAHLAAPSVGTAALSADTAARSIDWAHLLAVAWAAGMALQLAAFGLQLLRARRAVLDAEPIEDGPAPLILNELCARLRIGRRPALLVSPDATSPQLVGLWRPSILLPADGLDELELRLAIAHELHHLKRRDLWMGLLPGAVKAAFFFHPLAHLAHREYLISRELACDAGVLQIEQASARDYGRLLLRLATGRAWLGSASAAAAPTFPVLKRRLSMLNPSPLSSRSWPALAIGVAALALVPFKLVAQPAGDADRSREHAGYPRPDARADRSNSQARGGDDDRRSRGQARGSAEDDDDDAAEAAEERAEREAERAQEAAERAQELVERAQAEAERATARAEAQGRDAERAARDGEERARDAERAARDAERRGRDAERRARRLASKMESSAAAGRSSWTSVTSSDDSSGTGASSGRGASNGRGTRASGSASSGSSSSSASSGSSSSSASGHGSSWSSDGDGDRGDAYVIVDGDSTTMSGNTRDLREARRLQADQPGRYLWFKHGGRPYLVTDMALVDQAVKLFEPQRELGRKQSKLGEQQSKLGEQQSELGEEQAKLGAEMARLASRQARLARRGDDEGHERDRAEVDRRMSTLADKMGALGEQQGRLGEEQGELGERQGKLGEEQGRLGHAAHQELRRLLANWIANGSAQELPK